MACSTSVVDSATSGMIVEVHQVTEQLGEWFLSILSLAERFIAPRSYRKFRCAVDLGAVQNGMDAVELQPDAD